LYGFGRRNSDETERISKGANNCMENIERQAFAKVKAFRLSDDDFNRVLQHRHCIEDDFGKLRSGGGFFQLRARCLRFNGDENDDAEFVILVRGKLLSHFRRNYVHELSHIARWDL